MPILSTRIFNDAFLTPFRQVGDKAADIVVESIAAKQGREGLGELMRYLGNFEDLTFDTQPTEIQDFLQQNSILPVFANFSKLERAMAYFWKNEQQIALTLGCYSLPYCYAAADGAQVLWLSQRIKNDTFKRLEETGEFVFAIMQESDWSNGKNVLKVLKIRLMHAVVRYFTRQVSQWNHTWGLPINQEDMAGTNLAFSYIVIRGLRKLGVATNEYDEEAYLHFWSVVGAIMGVEQTLLPQNLREAYHLDRCIAMRQFKSSEAGAGLTKALTQVLQQQAPYPAFRDFPVAQMRFLLGARIADLLAIPPVRLEEKIIEFTAQVPFLKNLFRSSQRDSTVLEKYSRSEQR